MENGPLQRISVEKVKRLTLLVQKVLGLLDEQDLARAELNRESAAFFSHVDLASKDPYALPGKVLLESLAKIRNHLNILKLHSSLGAIHIDVLDRLYGQIEQLLSKELSVAGKTGVSDIGEQEKAPDSLQKKETVNNSSLRKLEKDLPPSPLSDRQQFMLRFASSHRRFQLKELIAHFPSLSEKTIRNDLLALCDHGLVRRFGVAPRSYYEVTAHAEIHQYDTESFFKHAESVVFNAEQSKVR